jgi:hypothetical protein
LLINPTGMAKRRHRRRDRAQHVVSVTIPVCDARGFADRVRRRRNVE